MTTDLLATLIAGIDRVLPEAAALRRAIHADPYVGGEEEPTRDFFMAAVDWLDWTPIAGTGAWARLGPAGESVGLRAELDALPITESTGVAWESRRPGVMHACGHDVHLAALWALLTAARDLELPRGMIALIQPREETNQPGASDVVASGLLDDEKITSMVAVHLQPQVERGIVSTGAGAVNAAFDSFDITVTGRPGHGAYPHMTLDPITVLATIVGGLGELPARAIDPRNPTVVTVGTIAGGTASNVIAETATCSGSIRTFSEADRAHLHESIARLAEGTAMARGATAFVKFTRGGPALVNDARLVGLLDPLVAELGLSVAAHPFRSCGSDDFAEYGEAVPSVMAFVGVGASDGVGLHHPSFLPGRDALRSAAHTLAAAYVAGTQF